MQDSRLLGNDLQVLPRNLHACCPVTYPLLGNDLQVPNAMPNPILNAIPNPIPQRYA